jgi:hypothetical protein
VQALPKFFSQEWHEGMQQLESTIERRIQGLLDGVVGLTFLVGQQILALFL